MKRMRSCGVRVGVRVRVRVGIRLRLTVTAKEAARLPRRHAIQRVEQPREGDPDAAVVGLALHEGHVDVLEEDQGLGRHLG